MEARPPSAKGNRRQLAFVALTLVALLATMAAVRLVRRERARDPVRPMLGVHLPAETALAPRHGQLAAASELEQLPWRATGDACAWLQRATGVPYADPGAEGWQRIDFCLKPEYTNGEILVRGGAWVYDLDEPGAGPKDRFEVQTYGGSVVEGYPVADTGRIEAWPKDLQRVLDVAGPGRFHVRNYAIAGSTSGPQLWRFRNEGIAERPDLAVLYVGENDLNLCHPFSLPTERLFERYVRTGAPEPLADHPWFTTHRADLAAAGERLRARLRAAADELDEALARTTPPDDDTLRVAADGLRMAAVTRARLDAGASVRDLMALPEGQLAVRAVASARRLEDVMAMARTRAPGLERPGLVADPGRVASSFLGDVPVEIVRASPLLANVEEFVDLALAHGIVPVVVVPPFDWQDFPVVPPVCDHYGFALEDQLAYLTRSVRRAMLAVAVERGVEVIDLAAALGDPDRRRAFFVDNVHLSREGMRGVATQVAAIVHAHATPERTP